MFKKNYHVFVITILAFILSGCQIQNNNLVKMNVPIKNQPLSLEVVTTPEQMSKGLSGRPALCEDCGMLFDYGADYQVRSFWMKDMNFSLDFVWLKDDSVVGFNHNVPAWTDGQITRLESPGPVNRVIEVNAGWISKNQLKIGDKINLD